MSAQARARRIRSPLPKKPPKTVEQSRMSLFDHLRELKNRLFKASVAILVTAILVGTVFYEQVFKAIEHPYCSLPIKDRPQLGSQACSFVFTGPLDGFTFRFKIAFIAGILISSPIWLYQLWAFVAPGLHTRERKYTYIFLGASVFFFATGATVAYLVLGTGLRVLLETGGPHLIALLDINRYLSYVTTVLLIFGVGFEFPLITTILNRTGILSTVRMRAWRRYVYFGMFVFAAFATPGGDPITMTALALPLCLLYEGSVTLARLRDRSRRRGRSDSLAVDTDDLDDEQASDLHYVPTSVGPQSSLSDDDIT